MSNNEDINEEIIDIKEEQFDNFEPGKSFEDSFRAWNL